MRIINGADQTFLSIVHAEKMNYTNPEISFPEKAFFYTLDIDAHKKIIGTIPKSGRLTSNNV